MGKRVKSVSMPGLAQQLEVAQGDIPRHSRNLWHVRRTVDYVRSTVTNTVEIIANRDPFNAFGWQGTVAKGRLDDDGLLAEYRIESGVPYEIGKVLDTAWESLT